MYRIIEETCLLFAVIQQEELPLLVRHYNVCLLVLTAQSKSIAAVIYPFIPKICKLTKNINSLLSITCYFTEAIWLCYVSV